MTDPPEFFRPEALEHHARWVAGGEVVPVVAAFDRRLGMRRWFWVVLALPLAALGASLVVRVDVKDPTRSGHQNGTSSERLFDVIVRPLTGALNDGGPE